MYAFIDSQTLRLINQGQTPMEIAQTLASLPPRLASKWYSRDYYGSLSHNVRAVYQRYMGSTTATRPTSTHCHRKRPASVTWRRWGVPIRC